MKETQLYPTIKANNKQKNIGASIVPPADSADPSASKKAGISIFSAGV